MTATGNPLPSQTDGCRRCGHGWADHLVTHGSGGGCVGEHRIVVDGRTRRLPCSCAAPVSSWHPVVLAVSGGRGFDDRARVRADLEALARLEGGGPNAIVHGGARGLDEIAAEEAAALGLYVLPPWLPSWHPDGDERRLDRRAGHRRNVEMLAASGARALLAYPDPASRGTWQCVVEAVRQRLPVVVTPPPGVAWREAARRYASPYMLAQIDEVLVSPGRLGLVFAPDQGRRSGGVADSLDTHVATTGEAWDAVRAAIETLIAALPPLRGNPRGV